MEFLAVSEKFFVEPANATLGQYAPLSMPEAFRLQQLLLNGQYLNRTTFANITTKECQTRYSAQFIKTGPGFGVVNSTSESQYMITNHVTWPNVSRYVDRNLTFHDETSVGPNLAFKHFNFSCEYPNPYMNSKPKGPNCKIQVVDKVSQTVYPKTFPPPNAQYKQARPFFTSSSHVLF